MWRKTNGKLQKNFEFKDFISSLIFVNKVGELSELQGHHPDILIHDFKKVRITIVTHSKKKITEKDEELAEAIDKIEI